LRPLLEGPVLDAAKGLLGARLRSEIGGDVTEIEIAEVEAYDGTDDPASHAYRGPTARNGSMFAQPGTAYVYRSYGVHWCLNVVSGEPHHGAAVLLRGGEPLTGIDVMERRRARSDHLTDGPGKLAQALGVTGDLDGIDLLDGGSLRLIPGEPPSRPVLATPRIGISKAVDRPWRFVVSR
jgi:DNA-3-methyladenine glycosylase